MRTSKLIAMLVIPALFVGCQEIPHKRANKVPFAKALVVDPDGNSVEAATFPYDGSPIAVTLDGSQSTDNDGVIVRYAWFSATSATPAPSAGAAGAGGAGGAAAGAAGAGAAGAPSIGGRIVPDGESADWPEDTKKPTVMLPQGIWKFSLWVIDNAGGTSDPSVVTVRVGVDPVMMCVGGINPVATITDACKTCLCTQSDTCRMASTACDETCWGLINCIVTKCPDFTAMAAKMDFSCFTANCSSFSGGISGSMAATPCLMACPDDCMAMSM
jgi:hypothetical protein